MLFNFGEGFLVFGEFGFLGLLLAFCIFVSFRFLCLFVLVWG